MQQQLTILCLLFAAGNAIAASLIVPGTANPWLAGMPDGATADAGDTAPAQSPILVAGSLIQPGGILTLSATGLVSFRPDRTFYPPDGGPVTAHRAGAENGIASFTAPLNALVGVFLADAQPSLSPAPAAFTHAPDALIIIPSLKQVFFIGDGLTSTGTTQKVLMPAGATRLFLGVMDGFEWSNNLGSFVVTAEAVPRLTIRLVSPSAVQCAWTTNAPSYQLEYAGSLPASVWSPVTNTTSIDGGEFTVDSPAVSGQRYFRLRRS